MSDKPDETVEKPKKSEQRAEVVDETVSFTWDEDEWTFDRSKANDLEFLSALDDFANDNNALAGPRAMKILLGADQAAAFFKGRQAEVIFDFVRAAGEAARTGNR